MIEIPFERLSAEVLEAVIEQFILREGTDYGTRELSLQTKIAQVRRQLESGDVLITFDGATESCTLQTRQQFMSHIQASEQHTGKWSEVEVYDDYRQDLEGTH